MCWPFCIAWFRRRPGVRPRRWSGLRRRRSPDLRLRFLQCIEHRLRVAGNLDLAPGPRDAALRVDQEGAALDAHDLAPVHVLLVDHVEGAAQRLVGVADQVEAERSEEHTSELPSLMRITYAVFCLKKNN